jgi:hypothetical protein
MYPGCLQLHGEDHNKGHTWLLETYGFDVLPVCDMYDESYRSRWAA